MAHRLAHWLCSPLCACRMPSPNILLLVGEDTGLHHSCYGGIPGLTPAIDQLSAEGLTYDRAYSTAPVCAPSRFALVTGNYAFSAGAHHMRSTLKNPPRTFTQDLREGGYFVNWANKTDFNFQPPADFADECSNWIETMEQGHLPQSPWFLYHNLSVTHESSMWAQNWVENVRPKLKDSELTRPEDVKTPDYFPDLPEVRQDIARYMDALRLQDREVARVLTALENSGAASNTVVIYLSDHGRGLPREKRWCYDAGLHMPLIIRWPGHLPAGKRSNRLVSWIDIAPTILSIAGIPPRSDFHGFSFLAPRENSIREYALSGRDRMDEAFDRVRTITDGRYRYIRNSYPQLPYAQRIDYMELQQTTQVLRNMNAEGRLNAAQRMWLSPEKPAEELYDASTDPDNVHNLIGDESLAPQLQKMRLALDAMLAECGDLGLVSERELVDRNLVEDRLEEYRQRIQPLPEHQKVGIAALEASEIRTL